jgi:AbiV family abortive infection protein
VEQPDEENAGSKWAQGFLEPLENLTDEQIQAACEAAFANAVHLLEEADILRASDRCARAYFLAHIACEELGKLPVLVTAAVSRRMGHEVDWRRIDRVLRSHGSKWKQVLFMDSVVGQEGVVEGEKSYQEDIARLRGYLDLKNSSLYSFSVEGGFLTPQDEIPCVLFDSFRPLAHGRLGAFESMYLQPVRESGGLDAFLSRPTFDRVDEILAVLTGPEGREAFEAIRDSGDESKFDELFGRLMGEAVGELRRRERPAG